MKKISRKIWFALLAVFMMVAITGTAFAAKKQAKYQDIDAIESVEVDYTKSNVFTLDGWYEKTLDSGRTVKMYFPEIAQCRAYFTVVAAPAGTRDVQAWAQSMGYTKLIADRGEVLVVLTAEGKKWQDLDTELAYVTEAMSFVNGGKNAAGLTLFTNYSTFYLIGYDGGCAPLEAWSAANPILVGSQVFIGGKSAGKTYLDEVGAEIYDGTNTGGYDPGISDLDEFKQVLLDHGYDDPITKSEVPVPTWFINYKSNDYSIKYWKSANDCQKKYSGTALNRTYWQAKDSDAFQTEYANSCTSANHGISKVMVSFSFNATAKKLGSFLYGYTRYNVPFAYSNHLSERIDYTGIRVAAQKAAQKGKYLSKKQYVAYDEPVTSDAGDVYDGYYVLARKSGKAGNGTIESGIIAYSDDNGDGTLDAREYLMYIPKSAKGTEAPVVIQYPGMTQSVSVGFDSTQWWRVADDEGAIIVIMGEAYNNGVALSWKNADMGTVAVLDILKNQVDGKMANIDWERIYGSGHSLGSMTAQNFAQNHPEFFTAVASTSFGASDAEGTGEAIPVMLVTGQADLPFLMSNLWTSTNLQSNWFAYLAKADSLKVSEPTIDNCDAKVEGTARTYTYTWNNVDEIPMVVWGQTYLREHNCYPAEIPMAWDFLKNYTRVDGTRYYQGQEIRQASNEPEAVDFDSYTEALDYDYSQAAQLPLTGWFTKTVSEGRTMKMYISDTASVRSYMTVVAIPDGVNTYEYLTEEGWFDVMEEKGEVLVVLEPGEEGWGSAEEEIDYVNAAMSFVRGTTNANSVAVFSTFGEFYFVGYGEGAAPLEYYAAQNPILVIAQEYIGGTSAGADALTAVASTPYTGKSSNGDISDVLDETLEKVAISGEAAPKDLAVPTVLADYTGSEAYWMAANNCVAIPTADGVYAQDINAANYSTDYANSQRKEAGLKTGLSQVKITKAGAKAAEIYAYLAQWTRYDTTFAYSNALADRLDYTAAKVAAQKDAKDGVVNETLSDGTQIWAQEDTVIEGHGTVQIGVIAFSDNSGDGEYDPREYLMYIPEGYEGKDLPVMMIYAGNSQTDVIFMDSTLWWQLADKNGIALCFVCETYSSNATVVSHKDSDKFYNSLITILKEQIDGKYANIDFTRIYGSGQSAGSNATQGFAMTNPEFFAAVASTSAAPAVSDAATYEFIPTMMITGQMDASDMGKGFDSSELQRWATYMLQVDGFNSTFAPEWASSVSYIDSRHQALYTWSKTIDGQEVPIVQWAQCLLRPHNCYPSDMPILWDYLEHYSKDENGVRYYSASAFTEDDAVVIDAGEGSALSETEIPATDASKGIYQPITGLYTDDTLSVERTAMVYIPEGAKYGSYSVMLNVPEGMDTETFLIKSGWRKVADENLIVIYALEPKADGTYGDAEEEMEYITAAYKSFTSSTYYKLGASYYFVGYGEEGSVMQQYAMKSPLTIAAAAYIDASDISAEYMASMAETGADSRDTGMCSDVPTPVWIMGSAADGVVDYYLAANRCDGTVSVEGELSSTVYTQTEDTLYYEQGNIGKVAVSSEVPDMGYATAAAIYDFLDEYFTYGSVASGWLTGERAVYGDGEGEVQTVEFTQVYEGEELAREYVIYDGSHGKQNVPLVIAAPGNSTSDRVMMDTSMWWKIAEENEFVVVAMTAIPGDAGTKIGTIGEDTFGNRDLEYVDMIVEQVTANYSIDTKRMYFSGQSQGSVFTHWVALNRADVFAAVASTSGAPQASMLNYPDADTYDQYLEIPYYLIAGQYDVCPADMPATGDTRTCLSMMIGINDCVNDVDNWDSEVVDGRYTDYSWYNAAGEPVVAFSRCSGRGHSVVITDNYRLYNWMIQWSK